MPLDDPSRQRGGELASSKDRVHIRVGYVKVPGLGDMAPVGAEAGGKVGAPGFELPSLEIN
jgi:hypothetical protein